MAEEEAKATTGCSTANLWSRLKEVTLFLREAGKEKQTGKKEIFMNLTVVMMGEAEKQAGDERTRQFIIITTGTLVEQEVFGNSWGRKTLT
jgi:hypothetical protein